MQLTMSLKREQGHLVQDAREDTSLYMAIYRAAIRGEFPSAPKKDLERAMTAPNNVIDVILAYSPSLTAACFLLR